jgi:uncharacterized protein YbbC (DUF1343 family)
MKHYFFSILSIILIFCYHNLDAHKAIVKLGCELLFEPHYVNLISGKRLGLITNHTAIDSGGKTTLSQLKKHRKACNYTIQALFTPEHGLHGDLAAGTPVADQVDDEGIPIYSLYGVQKRITARMVKDIDLLIYDIQDIGSRSYTYSTTLYYSMEEAAKLGIPVIVLDRPNPINGIVVDGPVLEDSWRSFVGYLSIPYCHGMTIGELARYFNGEYKIGCKLHVVPMQGWQRNMSFATTGLLWTPTSPNIPEATTPLYYPMTGILGELQMVSIGIGTTMPFKVVGAPWIDAELFAKKLNDQHFPGITFLPFHFRPNYGRYAQELCHGVILHVTDASKYLPVGTQYLLIGMLKNLYPSIFQELLAKTTEAHRAMFNKVNGTAEVDVLLHKPGPIIWALRALHQKQRDAFCQKRMKYLLTDYNKTWQSTDSCAKK